MKKTRILNRMFGIAVFAMLFGVSAVHAQSSSTAAGASPAESSRTEAAPSGATPDTSGSSGTPGSSAASGSSDAPATSGASGAPGSSGATGASGAAAQPDTSGASASSSKTGASLSKSDQNLMREIAQTNLAEIEAGKMAKEMSKDDKVQEYAQKMIDDHTAAQEKLQQLAEQKGVTLPTEPDRKHQTAMKKMQLMEGEKFDKRYMSQGGISDHRDAHKLLSRVQKNAKDNELKELAGTMLPTIAEHLDMAKEVSSDTGSRSSGSSSGQPSGAAGTSSGASDSSPGSSGAAGVSGTSGSSSSTSPGKQ